ncbi:hypothetical protein Ndes2526B_g06494 [Nannochloris sp. 'desiccata']
MEEDHMVGAPGAHSSEPILKRKRRRSSAEVLDLSEVAASAPSLRHLPRLRVSPPKQNQPELNVKPVGQAEDSPIYIDDERSSRPPVRQTSKPRRNTVTANVQQSVSPRRSSLRITLPATRRSRWREIQDTTNPNEQANNDKNNNDGPHSDGDGFLARRLQAEEEMRAARERRDLQYRMQELERAEAETLAAVAASGDRGQQARHPRRLSGGASVPDEPPRRRSSSSRAYNNSLRLFSNANGRHGRDYEGNMSTVERRRGRGRGDASDPFNHRDHISSSAAEAAATGLFTGSDALPLLSTGPGSDPRRGRGGGYPGHASTLPLSMGFSEAMSEFLMREAAAEAEAEAAWNREHSDNNNDEGSEGDIEDAFIDEMMLEATLRGGDRDQGRMSRSTRPFEPSRRRGGAGPGRPREEDVGGRRGHFSSILSELAALHQAVMGARNSSLPSDLLFSDRDFTEDDYEALLALDEGVENRKGAKQDVINQLHSERVPRGSGRQAAYGDCCICLDRINAGQVVRKLECCHHFHKGCVDKWLKQKASCPICQRKIGEPV